MNCPKCGAGIDDGKAYCSNPACGAVVEPAAAPERTKRYITVKKEIKLNFDLNRVVRQALVIVSFLIFLFLFFYRRN